MCVTSRPWTLFFRRQSRCAVLPVVLHALLNVLRTYPCSVQESGLSATCSTNSQQVAPATSHFWDWAIKQVRIRKQHLCSDLPLPAVPQQLFFYPVLFYTPDRTDPSCVHAGSCRVGWRETPDKYSFTCPRWSWKAKHRLLCCDSLNKGCPSGWIYVLGSHFAFLFLSVLIRTRHLTDRFWGP